MYPEIRFIGTIQAMDDPIQGKPDRVLTVVSSLRNGKNGSFRIRVPSQDLQGCSIGDEILVQGELDEAGVIQTLHGGLFRKLVPLDSQHAPRPETTPDTIIHQPRPVPPATTPAVPSSARPASPAFKPFGAQAARASFGGLFGTMRPQDPAPSQDARPSPATASQPRTPTRTPAFASRGFSGPRASAPPATATASSASDRPAGVAAPRQAWDVNTQNVTHPGKPAAHTPKSEMAEYLQDEIPW